MMSLGWALILYDECPYRRETNPEGRVPLQVEIQVPSQANKHQLLPSVSRNWEEEGEILLGKFQKEAAPTNTLILDF